MYLIIAQRVVAATPTARICHADDCVAATLKHRDRVQQMALRRSRVLPSTAERRCCHSCESVSMCTTSDGLEHHMVNLFLPHVLRTAATSPPRFLEIGGFDGLTGTNTLYLDRCLGWQGVMVEAHPRSFSTMRRHRPGVLSIHSAVCSEGEHELRFSAASDLGSQGDFGVNSAGLRTNRLNNGTIAVPCGKLTDSLGLLGIHHLTYLSLDVQGSELSIVRGIDWSALNISVLQVEEMRVLAAKNRAVASHLKKAAGMSWELTLCNRIGRSCDSFYVNPQLVAMDALRRAIARYNYTHEHQRAFGADCGFENNPGVFGDLFSHEYRGIKCMKKIIKDKGVAYRKYNNNETFLRGTDRAGTGNTALNDHWQCQPQLYGSRRGTG